jgi:hypothetical protein
MSDWRHRIYEKKIIDDYCASEGASLWRMMRLEVNMTRSAQPLLIRNDCGVEFMDGSGIPKRMKTSWAMQESSKQIWARLASIMLATASLVGALPAQAAEGVLPVGPIGGTDIGQALPMEPGLYGTAVGMTSSINGWYGNNWNDSHDASGHIAIGALSLTYVYEATLWGGRISSSGQAGYSDLCTKISGKMTKHCSNGSADSFFDLFSWARLFPSENLTPQEAASGIPYGLAVRGSFGVQAPIGEYSKNSPVNPGANFWDIVPSVALTYTGRSIIGKTFGEATEYSARIFYNHYTENHATDYQTADVVSVDFAVTQRLNSWQYGIAGYWYSQIDDDKGYVLTSTDASSRQHIEGNRGRLLIAGPIVQNTMLINGRPWIAAVKAGVALGGTNGADVEAIIFRLTTPF